eukprot:61287-Prymnesium_polylepis.4
MRIALGIALSPYALSTTANGLSGLYRVERRDPYTSCYICKTSLVSKLASAVWVRVTHSLGPCSRALRGYLYSCTVGAPGRRGGGEVILSIIFAHFRTDKHDSAPFNTYKTDALHPRTQLGKCQGAKLTDTGSTCGFMHETVDRKPDRPRKVSSRAPCCARTRSTVAVDGAAMARTATTSTSTTRAARSHPSGANASVTTKNLIRLSDTQVRGQPPDHRLLECEWPEPAGEILEHNWGSRKQLLAASWRPQHARQWQALTCMLRCARATTRKAGQQS